MGRARVLVVDDSTVIRRVVTGELSADPEIEVVGTAPNGRVALDKMTQVSPDLVILDIEMPEMDGLATLAELRKLYPRVPVVMFSALTERGATATLDALALGATDYFTKPVGNLDESRRVIREELAPAIKALCAKRLPGPSSPWTPPQAPPPARGDRVDAVAIGVSTGGPNALADVFRSLPADLPVPILIVQHMPPMFTRLLAERLTAESAIPVEEATAGSVLAAGRAWIAPGGYHMTVVRSGYQVRTALDQTAPECSCRPAADPLFRSVAKAYGANCLAVVMTGMGQDGLRGCEVVRGAGGQVLAQDEATSIVWGMPGAVVRAGLADRVLPLSMIGGEIVRRASGARTA
jgi:two-component system chemotaxis response regulator CheB